jgi:hypothetical protein
LADDINKLLPLVAQRKSAFEKQRPECVVKLGLIKRFITVDNVAGPAYQVDSRIHEALRDIMHRLV